MNGIFVGRQEDIDKVLVSDTFKKTYFKATDKEERIISVGKNHKKNMNKRINKKNKSVAPPAYEGPPAYS